MATEQTGRHATLGRLEFNPFTMRARLSDFALSDLDPQRILARFARLDVDVSLESLWKRAPVFDAVRLFRPQIELVRNDDGTYSIGDLLERATAQPDGPTSPFSINNIEVDEGMLALEDRRDRRRIVVSNLGIGIPFLSSLPYDAQIRVTPRLDGEFDGARFAFTGSSTSPFADAREATLELNLDALPLARYAGYASLPGGMRLADGALTTRLTLAFVTERDVARAVSVSGSARVDKPALTRKDGSSLAAARSIELALAKLDWLERSFALDRVAIDAPDIALRRDASGALEFERLFATRAEPRAGSASDGPDGRKAGKLPEAQRGATATGVTPWRYTIADSRVTNGILRLADEAVSPAFEVVLSKVAFEGKGIASNGGAGTLELRFDSDEGAHFDLRGELDLSGKSARGHFSLTNFRLAKLYPYYASALNLDVRKGTLDLAGDFAAESEGHSRGTRSVLAAFARRASGCRVRSHRTQRDDRAGRLPAGCDSCRATGERRGRLRAARARDRDSRDAAPARRD